VTDPSFLGFEVAPMAEPGDRFTGSLRFDGEPIPARGEDGSPAVRAVLRHRSAADAEVETALDVDLDDSGRFVVDLPEEVDGVLELSTKLDDLPGGRQRSEEKVVVLGAEE
jgi:hypothetical protein